MDSAAAPGTLAISDDFSGGLGKAAGTILGPGQLTIAEFASTLQPSYFRARIDLCAGWLALLASLLPVLFADQTESMGWRVAAAAFSSVLVGYWIAYIALFLHDGAHFGLAQDRRLNDLLTNLFVGLLVCQDVKRYRPVHWQHHLNLGGTNDPERSYFNALSPGSILRTLTGIQVLSVLATRRRFGAQGGNKAGQTFPVVGVAGIATHAIFLIFLLGLSAFATAAAWVIGVGLFFPFFGALRQLLEHRREEASAAIDYRLTPHGAYTRMFMAGPIGSTFGGAGFRRHLLHHWLPQVSYTNYDALEAFLQQTELNDVMNSRRTTYLDTFCRLFAASRQRHA